jgi:hypothetical protein
VDICVICIYVRSIYYIEYIYGQCIARRSASMHPIYAEYAEKDSESCSSAEYSS